MTTLIKRLLPRRLVDVLRLIRYPQYELVAGPLTYNQDGLATREKTCDFLQETRFAQAYAAGRATGSWGSSEPLWRAYILCWAARRAVDLPGDFVECGVNRGGSALTVIDYVGFGALAKTFYLLDTFAGPAGSAGADADGFFAEVSRTFQPFANTRLIRGAVPATLEGVPAAQVAYLHLDMNAAPPEAAAAEFFWGRLTSGAVVVLDDYGWAPHLAQKHALDEFAARHGVQVLPLPTGQGLLFKP